MSGHHQSIRYATASLAQTNTVDLGGMCATALSVVCGVQTAMNDYCLLRRKEGISNKEKYK
jgi:hypothetical protein